jgi:hypothetical protein
MRRLLLVWLVLAAFAGATPAARAAAGCAAGGAAPPAETAHRQVADLDGDGVADTLWVGRFQDGTGRVNRVVGVTTASGANSDVQISSASPIGLTALAIDAQNDGGNQIIVSDGRGARLYTFADCRLHNVIDAHDGRPFLFDLQNLRDQGTGVGCGDLGPPSVGRHLLALQALQNDGRWTVRRTEVDVTGTRASTGKSDTVMATSAEDPAVTSAETISCGKLTISKDGVQQP